MNSDPELVLISEDERGLAVQFSGTIFRKCPATVGDTPISSRPGATHSVTALEEPETQRQKTKT
jgi:hypothetical protein